MNNNTAILPDLTGNESYLQPLISLYNEDCRETMKRIPDGSVDLMVTDPPYAMTACDWDTTVNFAEMWPEWERILKPDGVFVFTASQPFTSDLVISRRGFFKCEWIWKKNRGSNFAGLKTMPFKEHESVVVFCRGKLTFNPIKEQRAESGLSRVRYDFSSKVTSSINGGGGTFYNQDERRTLQDERHPSSVQEFNTEVGIHPTQKPVDLMRYLILTYSNKGDTVFDGYSGSGTTAHACLVEGRKFVGSELDKTYYEKSVKRLKCVPTQLF